jgi:hypothetical protein
MHWILDVSLQEDACQIYRENAAENLACLRHMSLNMLRSESSKISVPMKQKRCMMNPEFLERVLLAGFASEVKVEHSCGRPVFIPVNTKLNECVIVRMLLVSQFFALPEIIECISGKHSPDSTLVYPALLKMLILV